MHLKWWLAGAAVIFVTGILIYSPVFEAGFWTDDFSFAELAARLSTQEYMLRFFDPQAIDIQWYRPFQGVQWWIEYQIFGSDPSGYHIVGVVVHSLNCVLLSYIVGRATRKWWVGLMAALALLSIPLIGITVFWPATADVLLTAFYLATMCLWLVFLQESQLWIYLLTILLFAGTLLSKEMGITLIVVLFLMDRLLVHGPATWRQLGLRYLPFCAILFPYVLIEYIVSRRGFFVSSVAYHFSTQIMANLQQYLRWVAFPWDLGEQINKVAVLLVVAVLLQLVIVRRERAILFLVLSAIVSTLPVLPFPFVIPRFAYLPVVVSAVLVALALEYIRTLWSHPLWRLIMPSLLALAFVSNAATVIEAAQGYTAFVRETRAQFRPIFQEHPTFSNDTLLYFIQPSFPTSNISGMMYLRYGGNVYVGGTDKDRPAGFRQPAAGFVYYLDEAKQLREQTIDKTADVDYKPELPARFSEPLRLEMAELASVSLRPGDSLALILHWRAVGKVSKDYTVFVHLVNANGELVAGYDSRPKNGDAATSRLAANQWVTDGIAIPINSDIHPGPYHVEIGLYDLITLERLSVLDSNGDPVDDKIVFGPIRVGE